MDRISNGNQQGFVKKCMTKAELVVKLFMDIEKLEADIGILSFRESKIIHGLYRILNEAKREVLEENNSTNIVGIAERDSKKRQLK